MSLVTRNVFIDTEFFVKANLDFNSRTIKSFEELCEHDEFIHITSTIVVKEVKRKISEQIAEALKGIKNFQRKAAVLRDYDDDSIKSFFIDINTIDIERKALATFDNFLLSSKAIVVDMDEVNLNEVIDMYFNQISPFSARKPNEFRDAFTLLAIRSRLKEQEKVYVISDDSDHKGFCEVDDKFISIEALSELLDIYNKHNNKRAQFVEDFLENMESEIFDKIKMKLEEADSYNYSTWEDSEVDNFEVINISDFDPQIIHLDDNGCQISSDITVKFSVDVSGPDTVNGLYDKEKGMLYTFDSTSNRESIEKEFSVELDLSFEIDEDEFINDDFELNIKGLNAGIEFNVEETSWEYC